MERLVAKIDALIDSAETHERDASPSAQQPATPFGAPRTGAPVMDSTQTVRALTLAELEDAADSQWFAIQLVRSERLIDAEQIPNLDIFSEYRLYSITGLDQDRVIHVLRVGFFSSELAAEAVAGYLATYFDSPVIKRVSMSERERFAERRVEARKDVGASGTHAVIELVAPTPLPERAADPAAANPPVTDPTVSDSGKRRAPEGTSLWSRLLASRNR